MKIPEKVKHSIQSFGGLLILLLVTSLVYLVWCPQSQNEITFKIICTEAALLFILWVLDGVTE